MADDTSTMEFVGSVAMKWLEDFADNPKRGSYMEAVADLSTLILGGAIEAAGLVDEEGAGALSRQEELEKEARAG